MNTAIKSGVISIALFISVMLTGCAGGPAGATSMQAAAAEYCERLGGERFTRESPLGTGRYCRLPDGRVENEWQLYQSEQLDNH
ncbi:DUF333 domain-containing protein [Halomonas sp. DWK9]|uniref:DUF333 domain-containing protein n=1 Tax=Halomonas sp. DWK9 TaxID=3060155 RepID=UPI00287F79DD|nr:DUF333 domain-containing protein [Halomonas sp. DWK9]